MDIPLMGMQVIVEVFPFIGKTSTRNIFNTLYVGIYILSQLRGIYYFHILIYLGVGSSSGFADSGASWGIFFGCCADVGECGWGRSMSML